MSTDKLLRVTQMNAIFLDNEIFKALLQIINDVKAYLPPGLLAKFEPELILLIRFLLLKKSVYDNGSTFGQQLLSIKYSNISPLRSGLYLALTSGLQYLKNRVELSSSSRFVINSLLRAQAVLALVNFVNLSVFLRTGTKPQLIERFLGLEQVFAKENAPRHFDSKYLARELLWNGFIEILLHVLPIINYHKIKRIARNYNPFYSRSTYAFSRRMMTIRSKCAHCKDNPIFPHHMGCSHIFCYVCLKSNQEADAKYECPVCEHRNENAICEKFIMEILEFCMYWIAGSCIKLWQLQRHESKGARVYGWIS